MGDQADPRQHAGVSKEAHPPRVYKNSGGPEPEPGYVPRPKMASASHPIKKNNTGLPKMALPEEHEVDALGSIGFDDEEDGDLVTRPWA